ncbi:MAG: hypothetical protein ACLR9M_07290 [Eggerthella lenta]
MDEHEENFKDIFRYTDVEYTPDGYTDVYRWDDFLVIAGDHVYSAMDTIDSVSPGGEYEGFDPQYAYTCEIVGCGDLFDGCALFRPVSHDGEDYIQIAFLRSDIDDSTGEYTERFEAGSFDMPAADALRFDLAVDLMDYFSGRTFEGEPGVSRGLEPREAVAAVEGATGCDLNFFEDFWLGSPGEIVESVHVGPYTKQSLLDFSYYAKELSRRYGFADSDILEIARHLPEECPDRFAAVKAYLDCEYVPDGDAPDEKTYRWGDFLEIAGGDARYAAMLVDRTAAGEPEEGLHPETLVDQDIRDGEAFMLPRSASRGDINRGCLACDGIVGALRENAGMRSAAAGWLDSYFTEVADRAPAGETCGADCLFACHVDIDGIYAERTGNPDGLRAYCDPMGVGWNYGPIYYFPRESIEQVVGQLCEDGDDFPILFDGERVIEAFDGTPVHMSVPVEVDGEKVWTCGYDFCWCETVAPDFSRARGHFPDATVAAWAAARSVNQSDGSMGFKERM